MDGSPIIGTKAMAVFTWLQHTPIVFTLICVMLLDILTGIAAAIIQKQLNSETSLKGAVKKAMIWLLIGLARAIDPLSNDVPETRLACTFFIITEGISILENAKRSGVPLPPILRDSLNKILPSMGGGVSVQTISTTEVTQMPNRDKTVQAVAVADPVVLPLKEDSTNEHR